MLKWFEREKRASNASTAAIKQRGIFENCVCVCALLVNAGERDIQILSLYRCSPVAQLE